MDDVREVTDSLLAEKPELESDLEVLLEVDDDGPWTFDEIPLDSGTFGEVVSRGLVEEVDDGYRVADRAAVRAALDGEEIKTDSAETDSSIAVSLPDVDWRAVLALAGVLVLVVVSRVVFMWGSVFRGEHVVLAGNDPWGYRYYVEQMLAADLSPFAFGSLPEFLGTGLAQDHLYVVVAWWTAGLLGGTPRAAGLALAWLPVVSAVLTALLVYLLAVRLTADRRIGLASVALLALTPAHAYRTALGFGDHHAFDYLWIALTTYALVVIATEFESADLTRGDGVSLPGSRAAWAGAALLGIGIAAQSLAWRAGPLLYLPVGGYAVYRAVSDVRAGSSPVFGNLPLIAGVGLAAVLSTVPATAWGWSLRWIRSFAPALLLAGVVGVLLLGELGHRLDLPAKAVGGGTVGVGVVGVLAAWVAIPEFTATITAFFDYLERTGQSNIAETMSLFSGDLGSIVGPILILGFVLYLALPYAGLSLWKTYRDHRPAWAVIGIYVVYFLVLSTVQLRFAGQLAVVVAVFAGIGFVHLAAVVDLTTRPRVLDDWRPVPRSAADGGRLPAIEIPDRSSLSYLLVLFLLVASISLVQIPVKQGQVAVDDSTYETATWIGSQYAGGDNASSAEYVFSDWGRNRVYNYLLDGDSESYEYAQDNYVTFLRSANASEWYHRLSDRNAVIVTSSVDNTSASSLQNRIHRLHGSGSATAEGLAHYRTVRVGSDHTVTVPVAGATIVGTADANSQIRVSTDANADGTTIEYERQVDVNPYGVYSVTVPYPGEYSIQQNTMDVSERSVMDGERYVTHNRSGVAHWPFDESDGQFVYDRVGGYTGEIDGATRVDGVNGTALAFDGVDDTVSIPADGDSVELIEPNASFSVSFWIKGDLSSGNDTYPTVLRYKSSVNILGFWARSPVNDFGFAVDNVQGERHRHFGIKKTNFKNWTHITGVVDREKTESRLYMNGNLVSVREMESPWRIRSSGVLSLGGRPRSQFASVQIDDVRVYEQALNNPMAVGTR